MRIRAITPVATNVAGCIPTYGLLSFWTLRRMLDRSLNLSGTETLPCWVGFGRFPGFIGIGPQS